MLCGERVGGRSPPVSSLPPSNLDGNRLHVWSRVGDGWTGENDIAREERKRQETSLLCVCGGLVVCFFWGRCHNGVVEEVSCEHFGSPVAMGLNSTEPDERVKSILSVWLLSDSKYMHIHSFSPPCPPPHNPFPP